MVTQRQITQKRHSYIYDGRPIESRIWSIERRHFQWPWKTLTPGFKVTPFFDAEYLGIHSFSGTVIGTYTVPYSTVSFHMTISDVEWLSKISNVTKHRTVSLRQLRYLYWFPVYRNALYQTVTCPMTSGDLKVISATCTTNMRSVRSIANFLIDSYVYYTKLSNLLLFWKHCKAI